MTKLIFKMLLPMLGMVVICSGCIACRVQLTPHVAGRVIDQSTKEPIPNAMLFFNAFPHQIVLSSDSGYFDFPAIHYWRLRPLGPKDTQMSQLLIIRADHYQQSQEKFLWTGDLSPVETNKTIYLRTK